VNIVVESLFETFNVDYKVFWVISVFLVLS